MQLETERLKVHTHEAALVYGPKVLENSYEQLVNNQVLHASFSNIFIDYDGNHPALHQQLFLLLLQKYIPVANNTYRKRLMDDFSAEKKQALRASITGKSKKVINDIYKYIVYSVFVYVTLQ